MNKWIGAIVGATVPNLFIFFIAGVYTPMEWPVLIRVATLLLTVISTGIGYGIGYGLSSSNK